MTFQARATMTAVREFAAGATGITIAIGGPERLTQRAAGYMGLGNAQPRHILSHGLLERWLEFHVVFGYRVRGAEETAELDTCDAVDALTIAFYSSDQTFGGLGETAELDLSLVGGAEYERIAGLEYRLYPIVVRVKQRHNVRI